MRKRGLQRMAKKHKGIAEAHRANMIKRLKKIKPLVKQKFYKGEGT